MDRPPSPLFVPAKSGVDADTQVIVGELFEFDLEVLIDELRNNKLRVSAFKYRTAPKVTWTVQQKQHFVTRPSIIPDGEYVGTDSLLTLLQERCPVLHVSTEYSSHAHQ